MRWLVIGALVCLGCDDGDDGPADAGPGPEETWNAAFDAEGEGAFLSVWGPAPDDIWAVGGQPEAGVAWRYDGTAWARASLPDGPLLNWVHGAGGNLWMVGNGGRVLRLSGEVVEPMETPTDAPLWGVWASSADTAWAVGGEARDDGNDPDPVILRWEGTEWTRVPLPEVDRSFRALFKVWGLADDDVWAVGAKGVILHWDGSAWTQQPSGTGEDLISLWGRSAKDLVIVGGRSNGVLARNTGEGWTSQVIAGQPGFNGVWMDDAGTAWIAGNRGLLLRVERAAFEGERQTTGTQDVLHGVWSTAAGHRVAVGGSLDSSPPWVGVALETGR